MELYVFFATQYPLLFWEALVPQFYLEEIKFLLVSLQASPPVPWHEAWEARSQLVMIFYPSVHSDWLKDGLIAYIMPVKAYKTQCQNSYVIRREADFLSPESITKARG